jgi:hypothetical protein
MKQAMPRIAALASAAAGALGVAGCNLLLDASDYAVGPNDASMTSTGNDDGGGGTTPDATSDATNDATGGGSSDAGTPAPETSTVADAGRDGSGAQPEASSDGGAIGDFCLFPSDCADGECGDNSWCTASCLNNSSCGDDSLGYANGCVTGSASGACAAGCGSDDDCQIFGSSYVCLPVTGGSTVTVCTQSSSSGGTSLIGDPCTYGSDCASNNCYDDLWCTAPCTGASDTNCGQNSVDSQNYCVPAPTGGGYQCAPTCLTSADCTSNYTSASSVCKAYGSQSVCVVPTGAIGDECLDGTSCASIDGGTCNSNFGWCTETCTTNSQCGESSSGKPNYCLQMGGSGPSYCVPGCTSYGDCAPYDNPNDTFCLPVGGSATEQACGTSGGAIGDPCFYDTDCSDSNYCGDQYTCTNDCSGPDDTSCGSNSQGAANACAYSDWIEGYECFAGCTTSAQCVPFPYGDLTCQTISGTSVCANSDATTQSVTVQVKQRQSHPRPRRH